MFEPGSFSPSKRLINLLYKVRGGEGVKCRALDACWKRVLCSTRCGGL